MKIATTQFSLQPITEENTFWDRVLKLAQNAQTQGASFLVLPEYFSLSWLLYKNQTGTFRERMIAGAQKDVALFIKNFQKIADNHELCIIAGTIPHLLNDKLVNRSWIFKPVTPPLYQDKIHMTRFEAEEWLVESGDPIFRTFEWGGVKCAVAICYDVEFPSYCKYASQAEIDILFVPTCTDEESGYWRVRHCAEARCVENQIFAVMSPIIGGHPNFPEIGSHYGRSAAFSPCDIGFPSNGILQETPTPDESALIVEIDLAKLKQVRKSGTVLNFRDSKSEVNLSIK